MAELWGRERLWLGTVTGRFMKPFPGDYSSAVSFVVTVQVKRAKAPQPVSLSWSFLDSLDGDYWGAVEDTSGHYSGVLGWSEKELAAKPNGKSGVRRFVLPTGPSVGVSGQLQQGYSDNPGKGTLDSVVAMLFWRGVG